MALAQLRTVLSREPATDTDTDTGAFDDVDIDEVLDVLGNERRRLVIRYAADLDEEAFELDDIVDNVAAVQYGLDFSAAQRKAVYVGMYQTHLDPLVEIGVLEPVEAAVAHTYRAGPAASVLVDVLDHIEAELGGDV